MTDYIRQKCQMQHSTKKVSEVYTQEHKQHINTLYMRNTLKKMYRQFRQKQGLKLICQVHNNTEGHYQKKKRECMRDYMRKEYQIQPSSKTSKVCTKEHKQSEPVSGNKNDDTAMPPKTKGIQCDYMKEYMQQRC